MLSLPSSASSSSEDFRVIFFPSLCAAFLGPILIAGFVLRWKQHREEKRGEKKADLEMIHAERTHPDLEMNSFLGESRMRAQQEPIEMNSLGESRMRAHQESIGSGDHRIADDLNVGTTQNPLIVVFAKSPSVNDAQGALPAMPSNTAHFFSADSLVDNIAAGSDGVDDECEAEVAGLAEAAGLGVIGALIQDAEDSINHVDELLEGMLTDGVVVEDSGETALEESMVTSSAHLAAIQDYISSSDVQISAEVHARVEQARSRLQQAHASALEHNISIKDYEDMLGRARDKLRPVRRVSGETWHPPRTY